MNSRSLLLLPLLLLLASLAPCQPDFHGPFTVTIPGLPIATPGFVTGDFDQDGDLDVFLTDDVLRNDGRGNFTPIAAGTSFGNQSNPIAVDLNGDGDLDLASTVFGPPGRIRIAFGRPGAAFLPATTFTVASNFPRSLRAGDIDGDGDTDLVYAGLPGEVLFNDGNGNFPTSQTFPWTSGLTYGLDLKDLNGDGDLDLFAALDFGPGDARLVQMRNNGSGFVTPQYTLFPGTSFNGTTCQMVQLNGSGHLEGVVAGSGGFGVFTIGANTSGTIVEISNYSPGLPSLSTPWPADLDGDGDTDFIQGTVGNMIAAINDGSGSFTFDWAEGTGSINTTAVVAQDFDGDDLFDLLFARWENGELATKLQLKDAEFKNVMVTEVSWGNPDYLEIANFTDAPVDLTGWTVQWRDTGTTKVSSPLTQTLVPGEPMVILESGGNLPGLFPTTQRVNALPPIGVSSGDITVALVDDQGATVDEVRISSTSGLHSEGGLGSHFRGLATRAGSGASGAVERIWGLDSNSGTDWTEQTIGSPGLENTSSGPRGFDTLAPSPAVVINEIDDTPDYIELFNGTGQTAVLDEWFFWCSSQQNATHTIIRPFPGSSSSVLSDGNYLVVGDGPTAPAELPGSATYVSLSTVGGGNIPWFDDELDCALYDRYGRLVDLVRATGEGDQVTHNHPRAPSHWADFRGAAVRPNSTGSGAVGRGIVTDTDQGSDWRPVFERTMGGPNGGFSGPPGHASPLDYRINETAQGEGLAMILNAGPAAAGSYQSLLASYIRTNGEGPFYGLGIDAIAVWSTYYALPPFGATLDARGSYRFDLPPGVFQPGAISDIVVLLQDPSGAFVGRTLVLEFDT